MTPNVKPLRLQDRQLKRVSLRKRRWIRLVVQADGYGYDTAGRLTSQTMPNSDVVSYQLDSNGNRTQLIWPDSYYAQYVYDQLNRLTDIKLNGSSTSSIQLAYDELSRRTSLTYANGAVCNYSYALNNDMQSLAHNFVGSAVTFAFGYNNVHQVTTMSCSNPGFVWTPSGSGTSIVPYSTANNLNQYPGVNGTAYSYDNNGCLTGGLLTSATFDVLNRMTQAVAGSITNNYWYDPLNRQARKSVSGTDTDYLYDGQQLIATYNDSGTLQSRYIRGNRLDEVFLYINGGTTTYLHPDRQGSVIAESDSSGANTAKYVYSPFGETSSISASSFGYTGQRYDSEIGLYNYKMRYYSPQIGRFLQPDPLNYAAGDLNLYGYVFNDPMNLIDPFGLDCGCRKPFNSNVFDNINSPWNWSPADADFAGWYLDQIKDDPTMKDVYNELFHSLRNYAWQQETFPPPPPPPQQPSKPFPPSSFLIDQNGDVIPQKPPGLLQSIKDAFTAPITPQVREDLTGQAHEQGSATNIAKP